MARQCWDEARHCEISVSLSEYMGTELGEYAENALLYEAACNPDPVLRLTGVNRALEGLAIDVFNTMKEFGNMACFRRFPAAIRLVQLCLSVNLIPLCSACSLFYQNDRNDAR